MRPAFFFNMILAACCVCVHVCVFACVCVCVCVAVLFLHHDDLGRLLCDARVCTDLRNLCTKSYANRPNAFYTSIYMQRAYITYIYTCASFQGFFFAGSGVEGFIFYRTHQNMYAIYIIKNEVSFLKNEICLVFDFSVHSCSDVKVDERCVCLGLGLGLRA